MPLASGIAYALTAATAVQAGDSGELAAVGSNGGSAHPPGYPLFILWSRLWHWLPAASPTHRVALASAMIGALGVAAVQAAARAWGASKTAAALAAALFAVSPLAWRLSSEPEVFMLNVAIVCAIVAVAAPRPWAREDVRAPLLAGLAGLALSNHLTAVFIAPVGLFAFVRAVKTSSRRGVVLGTSALAFVVGLTPYLSFLVDRGDECRWGQLDSFGALAHHFLRSEYGTTQLASYDTAPEPLAQLALLGGSFVASGIAVTLGLAACVAVIRRRWSWPIAMLGLSLVIAGPVLAARFNLPPRHVMAHVVERFHLLPLALASVLGAFGIDALLDRLANPLVRTVALASLGSIVVLRGALTAQAVVASHRPTTERYLRNVLAMLPPGSIFVASGDDAVNGMEYMQCTLKERTDVTVIAPPLLNAPWYAARVSRQLGIAAVVHGEIAPGETVATLDGTALLKQLVGLPRPVFLNTWFVPKLERGFASYPVGPLFRVARSRAEVPTPAEVLETNRVLFDTFALDDPPPVADTWGGARYADYGRTWSILAQAFEGLDPQTAEACRTRAALLRPAPPAPN